MSANNNYLEMSVVSTERSKQIWQQHNFLDKIFALFTMRTGIGLFYSSLKIKDFPCLNTKNMVV